MIALWGPIIRPIVEAVDGHTILEIGAEHGLSTKALLNFVRSVDGHLHCIDPSPEFDESSLLAENPDHLSFYKDLSLNVIPQLPEVDVALVDGDHNWYTVFNELRLIEQQHNSDPERMPLVFLHDIGWPYARRDLYYDPNTVPVQFRQPYAQRGIGRRKAELLDSGGLNCTLNNALVEGGPRNGVLTGIEDFLQTSDLNYVFINLPLYFGLGIMVTAERVAASPSLKRELDYLQTCMAGKALIELNERFRLNTLLNHQQLEQELQFAQQKIAELESELAAHETGKSV
jgi:hypothetical protein